MSECEHRWVEVGREAICGECGHMTTWRELYEHASAQLTAAQREAAEARGNKWSRRT